MPSFVCLAALQPDQLRQGIEVQRTQQQCRQAGFRQWIAGVSRDLVASALQRFIFSSFYFSASPMARVGKTRLQLLVRKKKKEQNQERVSVGERMFFPKRLSRTSSRPLVFGRASYRDLV